MFPYTCYRFEPNTVISIYHRKKPQWKTPKTFNSPVKVEFRTTNEEQFKIAITYIKLNIQLIISTIEQFFICCCCVLLDVFFFCVWLGKAKVESQAIFV